MFWIVSRKELMHLVRDRWLGLGLGLFVSMVIALLLVGIGNTRSLIRIQLAKQSQARNEWLNQDSTTGHSATHFGTTLYKLPHPLFAFDAGSDRNLGTAVRVESHRPLPATDPIAVGSVHPLHFDVSTPAILLHLVCPLIVILLTFASVTKDRELGILPLVMSTGVPWQHLMLAKMLKVIVVTCLLIVVPLVSVGCFALLAANDVGMDHADLAQRLLMIGLFSLLFLSGWGFLALVVSARAETSTSSLLTLLTIWTFMCIIIPRIAVELAYQKNPLPEASDLDQSREELAQYGHEGRSILEKLRVEVDEVYKKQFDVKSVEEIPLKMTAVYLTAVEDFSDQVYDEQIRELESRLNAQDQFIHSVSFASPYMAIRSISTALCCTDRMHHQAFYAATERHRRILVRTMNDYDARNVARLKPNSDVWSSVPPFVFSFQSLSGSLSGHAISSSILVAWFTLTGLAALRKPKLLQKRR